jgi:hypothetical protein
MNCKKHIKFLSISIFIILCSISLIGSASAGSPVPSAYNITGVTQHKQINGLSCGPAALEIMFDYWGADIGQKSITDVARSSSIGTYTWDMVRTGHFSHLSAAQGSFFPHEAPTAGFPERSLGYASFNYSSETFWWPDLKGLIAANIPVILLMKYSPSDDTGHYRVIVGYDDNKGEVYFMDPWGRDKGRMTNPDGTVTWNMTDFKNAWNYEEYGTPHPYWGAVMMPWSVNLETKGKPTADSTVRVIANIKYPCPQPFDCSSYAASNTSAKIHLPPNMTISGSPTIDIGNLTAGESATVSWVVRVTGDPSGSAISVSAGGQVSGTVPQVYWNGNHVSYPAYNYRDEIGGEASIKP